MSNVEQNVKQFNDEDTEIILSATVDKRDPEEWIVITVGSEYISLSVKNWEIVKQLADKALSNSNIKSDYKRFFLSRRIFPFIPLIGIVLTVLFNNTGIENNKINWISAFIQAVSILFLFFFITVGCFVSVVLIHKLHSAQ